MIRLLTNTDYFFNYFEQSSENLVLSAQLLKEMIEEPEKAKDLKDKIKELEHKNDVVTHETFKKLDSTFITPIDREDIHELIAKLDDVIDFIDSFANSFVLFKISEKVDVLVEMTDILHKCTEKINSAIHKFRNFKKLKSSLLHELVEINTLENRGDEALSKAISRLFDDDPDPIHIIKMKELYEYLERAIDCCEDVSNVMETAILKNS